MFFFLFFILAIKLKDKFACVLGIPKLKLIHHQPSTREFAIDLAVKVNTQTKLAGEITTRYLAVNNRCGYLSSHLKRGAAWGADN